jgi:HSP20 family protein
MDALAPWRPRLFPRNNPWAELEKLQDRLFGSLPAFTAEQPSEWWPAVDLKEEEGEFLLTAEIPGLEEKDVNVEVEQNVLTIKGEKRSEREEKQEKNGRWHLIERTYGSFQRSFALPGNVDSTKIDAKFENGVLMVHMPKRKESAARRIAVTGKKK